MATYQFRDVNENITATPIPAEAMQINGTYLETEITGYRTLYVKGREALSPELETLEIGTRDGSIRKSKRYPARIITVGYQIMAADDAAFREAYNRLGNILNVDDAEIIFNDEQDKFFIGTPTLVDEVDPGSNSITGEIEITCLDPLKYSVVEYEAETSIDNSGTIVADYGGTYKSFPILSASFEKDCGFVSWFNEEGKIIQVGDPDEEDDEIDRENKKSEVLISQNFKKDTSLTLWDANVAKYPDGIQSEQKGTIEARVNKGLLASKYETGSKWHGPTVSIDVPADSNGEKNAVDFECSWRSTFFSTNPRQFGRQNIMLSGMVNGVRKSIIAVELYKFAVGNNSGRVTIHVNSKEVLKDTFNCDISQGYCKSQYCRIEKFGTLLFFDVPGNGYCCSGIDIKDWAVDMISIGFSAYGNYMPLGTENNIVENIIFKSHNVSERKDVPNKFGLDDEVKVECSSGEIFFNGNRAPELGALGNDWEDFCLKPGVNQIGVVYSDWSESSPTFKILYREAFL